MTPKQAIHILMLSPCYWMINLSARKQLVRDYCAFFAAWPCPSPPEKTAGPLMAVGQPGSRCISQRRLVFLPLHIGS